MPPSLLPILLVTHIALAIALFLPSILLPFALRARRAAVDSESGVVRTLLWAQSHGTVLIGAGLAMTGLGLVAALGPTLLQQPWLLLALLIYCAEPRARVLHPAPEPAAAHRYQGRRPTTRVAGAGQAPALCLVPDGRPRRRHRLPHEHEAEP